MRILVIGSNGYIGSALVPKLLSIPGNVVYGVDIGWFPSPFPAVGKDSLFYYIKGDAAKVVPELLRDGSFDAVIFLAGLSNDPMAEFSPHLNFIYNAALPAFLAHEARLAGVKTFIHAGSCSVYGYDRDVTEETPPKTFAPYGVSKLMGERGCLQQGSGSMRVVAFRMGTVCGPSPRMRLDLIINAMVKDALTKQEIAVFDGNAERPILGIEDACSSYIHALNSGEVAGVYNLLSENSSVYRVANLVQNFTTDFTKKPVKLNLKSGRDIRSYSASRSKAIAAGFPLQDSIEKIVAVTMLRVDRLLHEKVDLEADKFYNIRCFKHINITQAAD